MQVDWKSDENSPRASISDQKKLEWIAECIRILKDTGESWTYIESGDTRIQVEAYDTFWTVEVYKRTGFGIIDKFLDKGLNI